MNENISKTIKRKFHKDLKIDRDNLHSVCSYGRSISNLTSSNRFNIQYNETSKYLLLLNKSIDVIVSLAMFILLLPILLLMKLDSHLESISDIFKKNKRGQQRIE